MRKQVDMMILDFSKAFDTVPHRRLLCCNIIAKHGATSVAVSFRILVEILSGPLAFVGSRFFNNFSTPFVNRILAIGVIGD
jgi:hypothetical protein